MGQGEAQSEVEELVQGGRHPNAKAPQQALDGLWGKQLSAVGAIQRGTTGSLDGPLMKDAASPSPPGSLRLLAPKRS